MRFLPCSSVISQRNPASISHATSDVAVSFCILSVSINVFMYEVILAADSLCSFGVSASICSAVSEKYSFCPDTFVCFTAVPPFSIFFLRTSET